MTILSFKDLGNEEDRYRGFLKKLQTGLSFCICDKEGTTLQEEMFSVFEKVPINQGCLKDYPFEIQLESVLTIAHFFFSYVRKKEKKTISDDFEKKVLLHNYKNEPDSDQHKSITTALYKIESFLKEIGYLIYPGQADMIENEDGLKHLVNSQKLNFVNQENALFYGIATTLSSYRNPEAHGNPSSPFYMPEDEEGDAIRKRVLHLMASFVILVLWYKYNDIYVALDRNGAFNPENVALKGADIIKNYIDKLKNEQFGIINQNIYKSEDKTNLQQIIDIKLKSYQDGDGDDDESDATYISINELLGRHDEHFTLLAGESGSGKTTMLAKMIHQTIVAWKKDAENNPLPIKIELEHVKTDDHSSVFDFFEYLLECIAKKEGLDTKAETLKPIRIYLKRKIEEGKCVLFIEGLNEIVQKDQAGNNVSFASRKRVIKAITRFSYDYPLARYFVTTRISGIDTNDQGTIDHFKRYDLQPLDDLQILTQINNYNKIVSHTQEEQGYMSGELWDKIKNHKIGELAQNPMQLMQIIELVNINGLDEEDFNIPLSQLYKKLIEKLIKTAKYVTPGGEKDEGLLKMENNLLRSITKEMFEKQCRAVDLAHIMTHKDEIITTKTSTTVEDLLQIATSLFILEKKNDDYNFRHDSWGEYYLAYDFAIQIRNCKGKDDKLRAVINYYGNKPEDFQKQDMMDILRQTYEILENEWLSGCRKERDDNISKCEEKLKKIMPNALKIGYDPEETIRQNERDRLNEKIEEYNKSYRKKTNENRKKISQFAIALLSVGDSQVNREQLIQVSDDNTVAATKGSIITKINPLLPVLAYATTTIMDEPCNCDVSISDDNHLLIQPKEIIRRQVLNQLSMFKKSNSEGFSNSKPAAITAQVNDILKPTFICIALLNDENLLDIVLSPFWFRLWIVKPRDEVKMFGKEWGKTKALNVISGVLIEHISNPLLLYRKFYELYKRMVIMSLPDTALQIERFMMRILLNLRDEQILTIIDNLTNQKVDEIEKIINRRLSANALLVLNNVDVMNNKLSEINSKMRKDDINFEYRFKAGIHLRAASKLMTKFSNPKVQELVIGKEWKKDKSLIGLLEDLPIGGDAHMKILSSVLMRHKIIKSDKMAILERYLVSEDGQTVINQNPWLLDLLPLDKIPIFYKLQYDQDVLQAYNIENGPYHVSKVYYQEIEYQGKEYAAIPQPSNVEEIKVLFVKFDGEENCHKLQIVDIPQKEREKYSNRPIVLIEKPIDNKKEGYIEFFVDQAGKYKQSTSFKSLIDIVRLNHPELYHTSICMYLLNGCDIKRDINDIYLFFKKKSCVHEILFKYLHGEIDNWPFYPPDICVVVDTSSAQTHLFSPLRSDISNGFEPRKYHKGSFFSNYPTPPSCGIRSGDFVLYEKNGMIFPLGNTLIKEKREAIFGFVNGTVIKNQHGYLVIPMAKKHIFYIDETTSHQPIQEGDSISFFPTIGYKNKKQINVAIHVNRNKQ